MSDISTDTQMHVICNDMLAHLRNDASNRSLGTQYYEQSNLDY